MKQLYSHTTGSEVVSLAIQLAPSAFQASFQGNTPSKS